MGERDRSSLGEMRATISNEIVRLQAEYYGKGPTRAKTYILEDLVVMVLEESFTRAEKTLAQRGERDAIEHIRRRFQQQIADESGALCSRRPAARSGCSCLRPTSTRTCRSRRSCSPTRDTSVALGF